MNTTSRAARLQQKHIKRIQAECDSYTFFNVLTDDVLFNRLEELLPEHRERRFPPTETLSMFLTQVMSSDRSCQNIVNKRAIKHTLTGVSGFSVSTGGYCRARQRLPCELVSSLACQLGDLIDHKTTDSWLWKGRKVKIVDGTTVTMPDTITNQKAFPQQRGQKTGLGFPICRIVGITSLSSGALLNAAVGRFKGKGGDEQTLLRSMQDSFTAGDLVLADAFFPTYFFIAEMQQRKVDILMEQQGARRLTTDFRIGKKLGLKDHRITVRKPKIRPEWMSEKYYLSAPESLTLREFKANKKIMVTTLTCADEMPKSQLATLYKSRWQVELDIRNIKETLGMNVLSCKSPERVVKEIWAYLLAYNVIRLLMAQSAQMHNILPRQLSFKHCLQLWLSYTEYIVVLGLEKLSELFQLMSQRKIANRPGRIEPRAVKRRPKPYPLLTKPRTLARADVVKYGHPKKLK